MVFEKVMNTIRNHNLIEKGDKIVLGISGGPDSVCLLHVLNRLKEELDIEIYAAHLNHQIRGLEAQRDALFVSQLCKELGIIFFVKSIDVPKYCEEKGMSLEDGARKLRYEMFYEIKEKTKSDKIAIGHNMNDQAETILMRIMRGTGLKGLRGIEYKRDGCLIRPILDLSRDEIEQYCEKYDLNPRIDQTNLESIYTRNKIRLELLPYMRDNFNPNIIESIVRMSKNLKNDSDFIDNEVQKVFNDILENGENENCIEISMPIYTKLHNAIKSRVIRYGVKKILGDTNFIDQVHIDDVMSLESNSKIDKMIILPRGMFAYRKKDSIILSDKELVTEEIEFCYNIPYNGFIKIKEINKVVQTEIISIDRYKSMRLGKNSKGFDFNKVKGGVVIRNREQGDKIKLAVGSKKIKDLFIDLKIPKEERCRIPIVLDEVGVMCVGDYRLSEDYKIDENTREVLKITFNNL